MSSERSLTSFGILGVQKEIVILPGLQNDCVTRETEAPEIVCPVT